MDDWWAAIDATGKYPLLLEMVKALLSCFHGPKVEAEFIKMGNVLDTRAPSMHVMSTMQTVKYSIMQHGKTSAKLYGKKEFLHDPVDKKVVSNLRSAYKAYNSEKAEKAVPIHFIY